MKDRWTENEVFQALARTYPSPAYVLLPQVRNGTGYRRSVERTADAIAVSVWPSRGLYFTGIEIKVSKSDWRSELSDAAKSAEWQKYCRYWYVAAPKGVVPAAEVPETWGLIECTRSQTEIVREAPRLEPIPPDMLLVCSILRQTSAVCVPRDSVKEQISEAVASAQKYFSSSQDHQISRMRDLVKAFEEASGLSLGDYSFNAKELGEAVRFVREVGADRIHKQVEHLRETAMRIVKQIDAAKEKQELAHAATGTS